MKQYRILIIIIIIVLIVYILLATKKKEMKKFTFPKEIVVFNNTKYKGIDTMAMVVLNKIMKFDSIHMNIYSIRDGLFDTGDIEILAYVEKNQFKLHEYNLYIAKKLSGVSVEKIISHEMLHVQQIESGKLIQSDFFKLFSIYNNDTIYYAKIPYNLRAFEIDAFAIEGNVSNELNKLLYK